MPTLEETHPLARRLAARYSATKQQSSPHAERVINQQGCLQRQLLLASGMRMVEPTDRPIF
eukprot:359258-Chlamydomonas_euryale.AAC.9